MYLRYKIILLTALAFIYFLPGFVFSQSPTEQQNLIRYWYYRDRLKHFVVPGSKQGESEMAGIRNRMEVLPDDHENIDFGQHGCYFGYYLGTLATEFRILVVIQKLIVVAYKLNMKHTLHWFGISIIWMSENYYSDCSMAPVVLSNV